MFVKKYGTGTRTCVGFHGWSGDHRTFDPIVKYLPADISFYSFDLPGIGLSPAPESWNKDIIVKLIRDQLQLIDAKSVILVGNCSGAILSLMLAKQDIREISRFVLIDPFAYLPWYFKIFLNKHFGRKAYMLTFANRLGRLITNAILKHRRTRTSNLTDSFRSVNHNTVYEYLKLLGSIGAPDQFTGLTPPIDIVYGRKTFRAVKDSIQTWKNIFPHAVVYELAEAGHLPIEESPGELSNIIFYGSRNP